MIAPNGDRRRDFSRGDEVVDGEAEFCAVGLAQPADTSRQPLKLDPLLRERDPAPQVIVVRKKLQRQVVDALDVVRFTGKGDPAERSFPLAEQWPDVFRHKAGNI